MWCEVKQISAFLIFFLLYSVTCMAEIVDQNGLAYDQITINAKTEITPGTETQLEATVKKTAKKVETPLTKTNQTFEPWDGEATIGVKLRQYPGLDAQILTVIQKGDQIKIKSKSGNWYEAVFKKNTMAYEGWVYYKYIKPVISAKEKIKPLADEDIIIKSTSETTKEAPFNEKGNNKEKLPVENQKETEKWDLELNQDISFGEIFQEVGEAEKKEIIAKKQNIETKNNDQVVIGLIKLLLKLSSVILSCIALLFSYKALQLAKNSYTKVLDLQNELNRQLNKQ